MVIAPARRAGDPGSNPGPGKNFSLKLLISTCKTVILKITFKILPISVVNIKNPDYRNASVGVLLHCG